MRKTAISRVSKKPHRIEKRFVSPKTLKELEERSGGRCEVAFITILNGIKFQEGVRINSQWDGHYDISHRIFYQQPCPNQAMRQPHHILKRSRGGKHTPDNLIKVCFECHRYIEDNETEAVKYGLSKRY